MVVMASMLTNIPLNPLGMKYCPGLPAVFLNERGVTHYFPEQYGR